jgi:AmmeMemoRadiSam system protein B
LPADSIYAKGVRNAAKAGTWYPADSTRIKKDIDHLTRLARKTRIHLPANKKLKALILPHAGYAYSGWTAAHAVFMLPASSGCRDITYRIKPISSHTGL